MNGKVNVPRLRFPEFLETGEWEETPLNEVADPVSERATPDSENNVLSLSGEHGIVLQSEFFGKKVAGENSERYFKIVRNDFVYNDRTTKASTYGTIKRLSKYSGGIVSPIYKCFRFNADENPVFWEWYFESGIHDKQLSSLVNEGARTGRFNISISQFLSTAARRPNEDEQKKIADFLSSLDDLITLEAQKLDTLKIHKKGLMQQLFPAEGETLPKLRFPEFRDAGEWGNVPFENLMKINSGKGFKAAEYSKDGIRLLQIENVGYGVVKWSESTVYLPQTYMLEYSELVLKEGDIVLALNRPVTNNELKIARLKKCDDPSILYQRVGKLELLSESIIDDFAFHICQCFIKDFVTKQSIGSDQPFISLRELYAKEISMPSPSEQQKIADCLTSLDDLITAQTEKLDTLKVHKKGLMQQLFPIIPNESEAMRGSV